MNSPRRHHRRHRRSTTNNHQPFGQISEGIPVTNPDENHHVQSWLDKVHDCRKEVAEKALWQDGSNEDEDDCQPHEPTWRPNNLPVARVTLNNGAKPQQQAHHFHDDITIVTSPAGSRTGANSDTRYNHVSKTTYHEENKARRRRSPLQDSQRSLSDESVFERRPRRKTRSSRYEVTKERVQDNVEAKGKKRQTRSSRHQLRSSRDVLDNFTSGAIADKRLIMKTNLTAGLFLNGRSSTQPSKLSDLAFNAMGFLEPREGSTLRKDGSLDFNERLCDSTVTTLDQDGHVSLRNGYEEFGSTTQPSPKINTSSSSNIPLRDVVCQQQEGILATDHGEAQQGPQIEQPAGKYSSTIASKIDSGKATTCYLSGKNPLDSQQGHSFARNVPRSTSMSQAPEYITRALIETGVYDGTEIRLDELKVRPRNQIPQDAQGVKDSRGDSGNKTPIPRTITYEDKGVMVSPWSQPSRGHLPGLASQDINQHGTKEIGEDAGSCHLNKSDNIRLSIGLERIRSPYHGEPIETREAQNVLSEHTHPVGFNMAESQPWANPEPRATSETVKGGNTFARTAVNDERIAENLSSSFWRGQPWNQPALYGTAVPRDRQHIHEPLASFRFATSDGSSKWEPPSRLRSKVHSAPLGYPNFSSLQTWREENLKQADQGELLLGRSLQSPAQNSTNESMKEFIERIEAESLLKWDDEQYLQETIDDECEQGVNRHDHQYDARVGNEDIETGFFWQPNYFI
ncbi:hypothetical protein BKA56DRAFT_17991 [Ilyonectria sp. MPI-CAGE-AT-0026]|nr:hypothetical protein BKA56DRAFT_17991 [Ilyonectria sp. MPI-CAGE-AT-0026]